VILIAGGSGFVGAAAVRRLVAGGDHVAVMTAHRERSAARIRAMGAEVVPGDVQDPASLPGAVQGAEVVVQSLSFPTYPTEKPRKGYTFEEFDHRGTERLVTAAARAGARAFVFVSGVGASPDSSKTWYRAKWFGEQAVEAAGVPYTILRPTWVYGREDRALNTFVAFHRWLPFIPVVGDGSQRLQPVFVDDLGEAIARAARPDGPRGTFEVGGPEVMTMDGVLATMMDVRGRRKPLVHFPPFLPKLAGFFVQFLPRPPISPDAIELATADAVADDTAFRAAFGVALTALRDGLDTYLGGRGTGPDDGRHSLMP
jgi:NADH dehydrogenase